MIELLEVMNHIFAQTSHLREKTFQVKKSNFQQDANVIYLHNNACNEIRNWNQYLKQQTSIYDDSSIVFQNPLKRSIKIPNMMKNSPSRT